MQSVTIAILSTILTMMTFLIIVTICLTIKLVKKGWIRIGFEKPNDNLIDELDNFYKEQING